MERAGVRGVSVLGAPLALRALDSLAQGRRMRCEERGVKLSSSLAPRPSFDSSPGPAHEPDRGRSSAGAQQPGGPVGRDSVEPSHPLATWPHPKAFPGRAVVGDRRGLTESCASIGLRSLGEVRARRSLAPPSGHARRGDDPVVESADCPRPDQRHASLHHRAGAGREQMLSGAKMVTWLKSVAGSLTAGGSRPRSGSWAAPCSFRTCALPMNRFGGPRQ